MREGASAGLIELGESLTDEDWLGGETRRRRSVKRSERRRRGRKGDNSPACGGSWVARRWNPLYSTTVSSTELSRANTRQREAPPRSVASCSRSPTSPAPDTLQWSYKASKQNRRVAATPKLTRQSSARMMSPFKPPSTKSISGDSGATPIVTRRTTSCRRWRVGKRDRQQQQRQRLRSMRRKVRQLSLSAANEHG